VSSPILLSQTDRRRGRILVLLVMAIVWGLMTHGTFAGSGDEPHYLMIAHSLAFDGDLDLRNDYRDARLIGGGALEPESHAVVRDGRLLPVHDVGMPLVFAPVVRVAYPVAERLGQWLPASFMAKARLNDELLLRHQIGLAMAFLTGLLARELFIVLIALGGSRASAFRWALLFAVTPPVLAHSFLFFTEVPAALITLFVFRRLSVEPMQAAGMAVLVGALTGFLLLVHARNVGLVAGLFVLAALGVPRGTMSRTLFMMFVAGAAAAALGRTAVNHALWGTFVTTPHAAIGASASVTETVKEIFVRVTGLLFDREHGLSGYAPAYLLAGPGLIILWARWRRTSQDLLLVTACYLVPVLLPLTNIHGWRGGWSPAARFLVPIVPLLWLGVYAFALRASTRGRVVVAVFVAIQLGIDAALWQFPKMMWNDGDGASAFALTRMLPTWVSPSAAPAFAIVALAAGAFSFVCARYCSDSGRINPRTDDSPS
jgi:hypothetical protein